MTRCKYPDWEGGWDENIHIFDKGICIVCGFEQENRHEDILKLSIIKLEQFFNEHTKEEIQCIVDNMSDV